MKILILRFSSIGDIVLTTPVIRCLKTQTSAEIHFLTKENFAQILRPNPYLDRVFTFKKDISEIVTDLKSEHYDLVIDLHNNLRSLRLKLALGLTARSFDKINFEKWLLVNTGIDLLPRTHIVFRYLKTVEHLGVKYDGAGLDYFIPAADEVDLNSFNFSVGVNSDMLSPGKYVAFVIGATHATKRLPMEKIIEFCQKLPKPIVLLGGKAEETEGQKIVDNSGDGILNLCGRLNLHQSASMVRQAAKVVTHDTGLMHVAAAFRKEIISVWGSTIPEFGMFPFYPDGMEHLNKALEIKGLRCRPCSKIGFERCPKRHFKCMNLLQFSK